MRTAFTRRRRAVATLAALAAPLAMIVTAAPSAEAYNPDGSIYELFLEGPDFTADPANARQTGLWGHEGPGGSAGGTSISADLTDGGTAWGNAFNDPEFDNVGLAFVPTSTDGSNETPTVTAGETALQAFDWWIDLTPFGSITGTDVPATDVGYTVSTESEFNAWVADGKPDQQPDTNLVYHDIFRSGEPVSVAPKGKSIYNRWAAGQDVSLVAFRYSSINADGVPVIGADSISGGKAITAWLNFTTGQNPNRTVSTSGAYTVDSFGDAPVDPIATTTALTVTPPSPQNEGSSIDLKADVSAASGTPTGSVEYFDGTTSLGTQNLAAGSATLTTSLPAGSHSLKAVYTPDATATAAGFQGSTSPVKPYQVNVVVNPTSTALAVNTGTATAYEDVILTGTVSPAGVAGAVQFKDGGINIGAPVAVDGTGLASLTTNALGVGGHTVTAVFTPTDGVHNGSSTSAPQTFNLAPAAGEFVDAQTIQVNVPAGQLTMSTPYTPSNPLDLGDMSLNTTNTMYSASATFDNIIVTDTRAGSMPWEMTALAGPLTSGSNAINGQNVGLTNLVQESNTGAGTITTTNNPAADPAVDPADAGSLGLGGTTPHTVMTADHGPGTVTYHGTLTVDAPTSTQAGLYTGTVTFTVS